MQRLAVAGRETGKSLRGKDRVSIGLLAMVGALVTIGLGWFALIQNLDRQESEAIAGAQVANVNLARVFNEHVLRIVRDVDLQSRALAREVERNGIRHSDPGEFYRGISAAMPYVLRIGLIDSTGYLISSSLPVDPLLYMGDREHFKVPRESNSGSLFIGQPITSRSTQTWWIPMTQRLNTGNGQFAGVVMFAVDPGYFSRFYANASPGEGAVVTLFRTDGTILARHPDLAQSIGRDASALPDMKVVLAQQAGFRVTEGAFDGNRRVIAFDSLNDYPLKVMVGTSLNEVSAPVANKKPAYFFVAILLSAILLCGAFAIDWLDTRRRRVNLELAASRDEANALAMKAQNALIELQANEKRFRSLVNLGSDYYWEQDKEFRYTVLAEAGEGRGVPKPQAVLGKTRWETPGIELGDQAWAQHRAVLEAHQPFHDFEYWRRNADGRRVCISVSGEPVFDDNGKFRGYRGVGRIVTERNELMRSAQRLEALSERTFKIQEGERTRLARELHDQIEQAVTALTLHLHALERDISAKEPASHLREALRIAEQTARQVHNLSLDLRPPHLDELGLAAALEWDVERKAEAPGLRVHFDITKLSERLDPALELACFRIEQEALNNVIRHAGAAQAWVALRQAKGELELRIRDDGVGFDADSFWERPVCARLGLIGMEERAKQFGGRLEIHSAPGSGTEIRAVFPVSMPAQARLL